MAGRTVGLPTPSAEPKAQPELLRGLKEATEVGSRTRGDPMKSYVRLEELVQLGFADKKGTIIGNEVYTTQQAAAKRIRTHIMFRCP